MAGDAVSSPGKASETLRELETIKYAYSLIANSRRQDARLPVSRETLSPCPDPGLTALAQLGAFRLGASHALISLFDRQRQYVVAEATHHLPLSPSIRSESPQLFLCGTSIPRSDKAACSHVIIGSQNGDGGRTADALIVPSIAGDDRFSWEPYSYETPFNGFYAGIPIQTPRGVRIGVYCVFDSRPRSDLKDDEAQFLRDISGAVMNHLELRTAAEEYRRTDRMVRGLGSFVEGKTTLASDFRGFENAIAAQEGTLNVKQGRLREPQLASASADEPGARPGLSVVPRQSHPIVKIHPAASIGSAETPSSEAPSYPVTILSGDSRGSKASSITSPDTHLTEIRQIFSRASNIIRESVEVEGVLFLDASISSFGGLVKSSRDKEDGEMSGSHSPSSSSDDMARPDADQTKCCSIFGFSTSEISSIDGDMALLDHTIVPEALLEVLLRRYPNGKIFNFDEDGASLSGDSEGEDQVDTPQDGHQAQAAKVASRVSKSPHSRQVEANEILAVFQGARSVALVPIWDSSKERWYSCALVWTKDSNRRFTVEGELSYLTAFGTTVMAEVIQISTMLADKAKSDVLNSLSHELRSPLHGVIAGVELLQDSVMDAFQTDVLHTIETSGRTLLDTLDHLLDYSKINSFLQTPTSRKNIKPRRSLRKGSRRTIEAGMMSLISDTRVDLLIEEVAESIFTGFNFQRASIAQVVKSRTPNRPERGAMQRMDSIIAAESFGHEAREVGRLQNPQTNAVLVFLDIDPNVSWSFRTQAGALRRIVMNLFGNCLKYTSHGFIWVSLRQAALSSKHTTRGARVLMTFSDSGKGISEEYLRTRLFVPFSQEDRLAPGSGLGLSLVQQITAMIGGSITVSSRLGFGTTVRVSLPMTYSPQSAALEPELSDRIKELQGVRVCLRGFDGIHERISIDSFDDGHTVSEGVTMANLCQAWLGMEVVSDFATKDATPPDVFLYSEDAFAALDSATISTDVPAPALIICKNVVAAHSLAHSSLAGAFEFISQPIGPRTLAKSIVIARTRWKNSQPMSPRHEPELVPSNPRPSVNYETIEGRANTPASASALPMAVSPASSLSYAASPTADSIQPSTPTGPTIMKAPNQHLSDTPDQTTTALDLQGGTIGRPPVLLLVDDNDINIRILSSFAQMLQYESDAALNGLEALHAYTDQPDRYHCVFMDISMPVMDGLEATQKIRQFERQNHLKPVTIIALTGLASSTVQRDAFANGIDLFLTKPVKLKELKQILGDLESMWASEPVGRSGSGKSTID